MRDAMRNYITILSIWIFYTDDVHAKGYCSFPHFIWAPMPDGSNRKWLWKTEYFRNSDTWENQNELTVMETEITVQPKVHTPCNQQNPEMEYAMPCYRHEKEYQIVCVTEEPGGKYRVREQYNDGRTSFSCLQFRQLSADVLIVYKAATKNMNEDRLCYDEALQRDPWPWIATVQSVWSPCPIQGGFDFKGTFSHTTQMLCPLDWRPSRIESECVRGEGVTFFFPNKQCNPFTNTKYSQSFQCWASWKENGYSFVLMGANNKEPRYIMRMPEDANSYDEFVSYLYTSPIVTLNETGVPTGNEDINYIKLQMLRSEPGLCYDESPLCREYAMEGKCTNSALHNYGNYCKKSCGLCDFAPSAAAECKFPEEMQGDWVMFDDTSREEVTVAEEVVRFSTLGTYTCKSKHWENEYYKTLSVFTNGCRPRYSCLLLMKEEDDVIKFKLSRSSPVDNSFRVCRFEDDPLPLGGKIRSRKMKTFLPMSSMFYGSCGVGGLGRAEVSIGHQRHCTGRIWDVDPDTCDTRSLLTVSLPRCHIHHEFLCVAFTRLLSGGGLLVFKQEANLPRYYCWRLTEETQRKSLVSFTSLQRVHCDTSEPFMFSLRENGIISINVFRDLTDDSCGKYSRQASDDHAASHLGINVVYDTRTTSSGLAKVTPPWYADDRRQHAGTQNVHGHGTSSGKDKTGSEHKLVLTNPKSANAHMPDSAQSGYGDSKTSHSTRHDRNKDNNGRIGLHPITSGGSSRASKSSGCSSIPIHLFAVALVFCLWSEMASTWSTPRLTSQLH